MYVDRMKDKIVLAIATGLSMVPVGITVYNYYVLPANRHAEMMGKLDSFEKRLKKFEDASSTK